MHSRVQLHHFSHFRAGLTLRLSCFFFVAANIHSSPRILPGHCASPCKVFAEPFSNCYGYCSRPALGVLQRKECVTAGVTLSFEWLTLFSLQHVMQDASCLHHFLYPFGFCMHSCQKESEAVSQDAERIFSNSTCPGQPETICINRALGNAIHQRGKTYR